MLTGSEKILSSIMAILLALVVILGYLVSQSDENIGEGERVLNELHQRQIKMYEAQQDSLYGIIAKLQSENKELSEKKKQAKIITAREADSIYRLTFDEQADFWAAETSRIDSIQRRYFSDHNKKRL